MLTEQQRKALFGELRAEKSDVSYLRGRILDDEARQVKRQFKRLVAELEELQRVINSGVYGRAEPVESRIADIRKLVDQLVEFALGDCYVGASVDDLSVDGPTI